MKEREVTLQKFIQRLTDIVLVFSYLWTVFAFYQFSKEPSSGRLFFNLLIVPMRYFFIPLDPASEEKLPTYISRDAVFASYLRYMIAPKSTSMMGKFNSAMYAAFPGIVAKYMCKFIGFIIASIHMIVNGYIIMIYQTVFTYRNRKRYKKQVEKENTVESLDDHQLKMILQEEDYKFFKLVEKDLLEKKNKEQIKNYSAASYQFFKRINRRGQYTYPPVQRYLQVGEIKAIGEPITLNEKKEDDLIIVVKENGKIEYVERKQVTNK